VQEVSFSLAQRKLAALDEITLATGGAKAHGASRLEEISRGEGAGFAVPPGAVIPFGVMEDALRSSSLWEEYSSLLGSLNLLPQRDFDDALQKLKDTVREVKVPDALIAAAVEKFGAGTRLMVRSSASCEDTERLSGAGLYDSIPNVRPPAIARAVAQVWASLWNARAARDILDAGVSPERIHMAVLLQAMIFPDFSFIAHTMNPLTGDRDEIYLELAVGMGETLASAATPGMPYRLLYDRHTDTLRTLAFASFSHAAWPGSEEKVIRKTVDYSKVILSVDDDFRNALGTRIGKIGALMDNVYGCPLDIEGLVSGDTIYLVQARRQQGIM
jgi:phosphoglucan,water dikinase